MIELLKQDFLAHYGLRRSGIVVLGETTSDEHFDLIDKKNSSIIVAYRNGNVSFDHANQTEIEVINYESFLNGLTGTAFERGRKRCDFIMYEKGGAGDSFFLLNEQTSSSGSTVNLSKPILKDKKTVFPGGKYEKVEAQLVETLRTLNAVSSIASFINKYQLKIALMSYEILSPNADTTSSAIKAFTMRYKQIESRETGENGAILEQLDLNAQGFEYRRISHNYSFKLS